MSSTKKKNLINYPEPVPLIVHENITKQMKNCICQLYINGTIKCTGFFCRIPFPDDENLLPVLITSTHNISLEKKINLKRYIDKDILEFDLNNRIIFTDKELDITIIEIKEKKDGIYNFLEIEENLDINFNVIYTNETIYALHFPGKNNISASYGILKLIQEDKKYNFTHTLSTLKGSSGGPILNLSTNKVIGVHKGACKQFDFNIGIFLNYAINEFIKKNYNNDIFIKRLSQKIKLNIKNIDYKDDKLNLSQKLIGKNLDFLSRKDLKNLKKLYINDNRISDITILKEAKFKELEELDLGTNHLSNIDVLRNVDFKQLKLLFIHDNNISDINVFEYVDFKKIEILAIGGNKISDINVLEKVNFKKLKRIYLNKNMISDIKVLEKVKFYNLEILHLGKNKISDINVFEKVHFNKLKELHLNENNISDIGVLEKVKFKNLEKLILGYNNISNINILEKVYFQKLNEIDLRYNNISDVKIFDKIKIKKDIVDLEGNNNINNNNNTSTKKSL